MNPAGAHVVRESTGMPVLLRAALISVSIDFAVGCAVILVTQQDPVVPALILLVAGVLVPLVIAFIHADVAVDSAALTLRMWPIWSRRIAFDEITDVVVRSVAPLAEFGGFGLRFAGSDQVALVMRSGPAVHVSLVTGRSYLVGTADPESLVTALRYRRGCPDRQR